MAKTIWGEEIAENGLNDIWRERDIPIKWNGEKSAKAHAALGRFIHMRACIKDSITVCDWVYPIMTSGREDRKYTGDVSVEYKLFELVTGEKMNQEKLKPAGGQNLEHAQAGDRPGMGRRQGRQSAQGARPAAGPLLHAVGRAASAPYPPAEHPHPPLDRDNFEQAKTEYYTFMGWDTETGLPKRSSLEGSGHGRCRRSLRGQGLPASGLRYGALLSPPSSGGCPFRESQAFSGNRFRTDPLEPVTSRAGRGRHVPGPVSRSTHEISFPVPSRPCA